MGPVSPLSEPISSFFPPAAPFLPDLPPCSLTVITAGSPLASHSHLITATGGLFLSVCAVQRRSSKGTSTAVGSSRRPTCFYISSSYIFLARLGRDFWSSVDMSGIKKLRCALLQVSVFLCVCLFPLYKGAEIKKLCRCYSAGP